jgi:hypothetical protein
MTPVAVDEVRLLWSHAAQALVPVQGQAPGKYVSHGGRFIKGPIPLDWIGRAACLPGKTLHVALALQYLSGLQKTHTVKLGAKALAVMGVARDAKYEALDRLEEVGLITVERTRGRIPVVTILAGANRKADQL